ncbi:acyltransferase [Prescottella equi]|uniref:acyltransferase family protein n=1 Tax=Rhodococcus hoagii TaxID=43767 RepID=UPI000A11715E|nr:acyltransferase [Prescottella equi]MBM4734132.1 acyltransferase family protein [Prescottella equi]ORL85599.1 acyltransferase [Prescottella equi]ORM11641.1 acyltransferase [Prescottella equi]
MSEAGYIRSLTGLRAVAALLVVGAHAAFWTGRYTPDLAGGAFSRLEIGVAIFFVLSGFLLFRPWLLTAAGERALPSTRTYLWHRARRILPAYWITVAATYAIYLFRDDAGETGLGWSGFVRNMTLTQIYGPGHLHTGLTQMWSLAVEVTFYLLLPVIGWLLVVVVCRREWHPMRLAIALLALVSVSPLWTSITHGTEITFTARLWLPGFLAWFAGGMLLALASVTIRRCNPYGTGLLALYFLLLACTPLAGEATIVPSNATEAISKSMLYLLFATALMAPLVIGDRPGPLGRLCSSGPMVLLGEISYEMFLVHLVVMEFVVDMLGYRTFQGSTVGVFVVTVAFSVPIAWALHRTLERVIPSGPRVERGPMTVVRRGADRVPTTSPVD